MGTKRFKRGEGSSKDKISALPDDILCSILSLLPLKEAVRTSKVSHRWRYVWKGYVKFSPNMDFDVFTMRANNYFNLNFYGKSKNLLWSKQRNILGWVDRRQNFVSWVERMMQENYINNDRVMNSFSLCFSLNKDFAENIDLWINTAIAKGVQNFKIDFSSSYLLLIQERYTFPCSLFTKERGSSVKCLFLSTVNLGTLDFKCFDNLVDLHLEKVHINVGSITKLLTECTNLEKLSLVKLWIFRANILEISALKLKHLRLDDCFISDKIKINAINLVKLEYVGIEVKFSFLNSPPQCLTDVTIDFIHKTIPATLYYALGGLSKDIPNVESLILTVSRKKDITIRRHFLPQFANLKTLVLKASRPQEVLWGFVPLLFASPYLHRLELHLFESASKSSSMPGYFADTFHNHLKEITFTGFSGTCHEIEFVGYLLSTSKALNKMTIDCNCKKLDYSRGNFYYSSEKKKIERRTRTQLKKSIPSGLQFLFV